MGKNTGDLQMICRENRFRNRQSIFFLYLNTDSSHSRVQRNVNRQDRLLFLSLLFQLDTLLYGKKARHNMILKKRMVLTLRNYPENQNILLNTCFPKRNRFFNGRYTKQSAIFRKGFCHFHHTVPIRIHLDNGTKLYSLSQLSLG